MTASCSPPTSTARPSPSRRPTGTNALAANLLVDGEMVANPNTMWSDVNGDLPAQEIAAFIPGTRTAPAKSSRKT
jgi:hypothetical protein